MEMMNLDVTFNSPVGIYRNKRFFTYFFNSFIPHIINGYSHHFHSRAQSLHLFGTDCGQLALKDEVSVNGFHILRHFEIIGIADRIVLQR